MIGTPSELCGKLCFRTMHLEEPRACEADRCAAWTWIEPEWVYAKTLPGQRPKGFGFGLVARNREHWIWRRAALAGDRRGYCGAVHQHGVRTRDSIEAVALLPSDCEPATGAAVEIALARIAHGGAR